MLVRCLRFLQSPLTQRITILSETSQHWVPQIFQFMLKTKIGNLRFPVEPQESRDETAEINVNGLIEQIENEKQEAMFRSLNQSQSSSPKRDKFFESRKFSGLVREDPFLEDNLRSISNAEEVYGEDREEEEENFET